MRTMITSLILLSRTCALYICYSVDVTSEEIFPEKCSYSEELSVKEIRIRLVRGAVLRRAASEETQPPALTVLSNQKESGMTLSGSARIEERIHGRKNTVKWALMENGEQRDGISCSLRTAVLLRLYMLGRGSCEKDCHVKEAFTEEDLHVARSLQEEAFLVSEDIACEDMFL
jgi:hypothetical protein